MALLMFAAVVPSCSDSPGQGSEDPARWSMSFVWSAAEGLDLDGPEMTLVRAEMESKTIAAYLGENYGYPINGDIGRASPDIPLHGIHEGTGTAYFYVKPVDMPEPTTYDPYGPWIYICRDMRGTAEVINGEYIRPKQSEKPDLSPNHAKSVEIDTFMAQFKRNSDSEGSRKTRANDPGKVPDGPPMQGPPGRALRPVGSVDSELYSGISSGISKVDHDETLKEACDPWIESRRQQHPDRVESTDPNIPPAIEPFYPGWPS